jgi:hypothetical protein
VCLVDIIGGMDANIMAGSRKKTAGGVFFHLVKSSEIIPEEVREKIFTEEKIGRKETKKLAKDLESALKLF